MNFLTNRSFVCRRRRITTEQQQMWEKLWQFYGLPYRQTQGKDNQQPLDLNSVFGRCAEKHLEIGFGMGDALLSMATQHPEHDYLGIEVHQPGIIRLLMQLELADLHHVRLWHGDAVQILQTCLPNYSLDSVYILFPDPWHKQRHHKRRLIQPAFITLLAQKIKVGGYLHLATDWQNYANSMLRVLEAAPEFVNCIGTNMFAPRPIDRPMTKFERRGHRLGHGVWDLQYQRQTDSLNVIDNS